MRCEGLQRLLAIGIAALLATVVSFAHADDRRPNVLLIFADDLGYETLGCNGGQSYRTPHLDRLAAGGTRFTHCYATPLCTPSRVQLMTGRYNFNHYTRFADIPEGSYTFGQLMKSAGYTTCFVGKWQLGGTKPDDYGFDDYSIFRPKSTYWGQPLLVNGEQHQLADDVYGPDYFTEYVLRFMREHRDEPFFVYFPIWLTHAPFQPTPDSADRDNRDRQWNFTDMVEYLDKLVGRLVTGLDEMGLRDETLVIFTSDNGTPLGIESRWNGRVVEGRKGFFTDAGTRVPLIANWPGRVPAGRVCDDLIDLTDFLPTLAEVAGASPPEDAAVDGRSFHPQLLGKPGTPREWIVMHYVEKRQDGFGWPRACFVRDRRHKLYGYYERRIKGADERVVKTGHLYDVTADPDEQNPLSPSTDHDAIRESR